MVFFWYLDFIPRFSALSPKRVTLFELWRFRVALANLFTSE